MALGEIGPSAEAAIPRLIQAMRKPGQYWYDSPAQALVKIGPASVPYLVKEMKRNQEHGQFGPGDVLRQLGPNAAASVPYLLTVFADDSTSVVSGIRLPDTL